MMRRSPHEARFSPDTATPRQKSSGGDPGQYNPRHSGTGRRQSIGYIKPLQGNLLASVTEGKRKGNSKSRASSPAFSSGSARTTYLDMEDDNRQGPGPGSYSLLSTFDRAASPVAGKKPMPNAIFRSKSPQRPSSPNEHIPGAGTYSPIWTSVDPNQTNSAPHLVATGDRFGAGGLSLIEGNTDPDVGPGKYEGHLYMTLAKETAARLKLMSKQAPGFGGGTAAHLLPHEEVMDNERDMPGPGAYETNTSNVTQANGHSSRFMEDIGHTIRRNPRDGGSRRTPTKSGRRASAKQGKPPPAKGGGTLHQTPKGTVHV